MQKQLSFCPAAGSCCFHQLNSVVMRKRYFPPVAKSISVGAFIIAASGEVRRRRKASDFDEDDYDGEGSNWNIWNR